MQDLRPNERMKEWTKETLNGRNSSARRIRREDVLRGIREEEERKRRLTGPLDVEKMPTLYNLPAIPKSPPLDTGKMVAQIFPAREEEDIFVEKVAPASVHTIDLICQASEELNSMPTLVVVSVFRWIVNENILRHFRYYWGGVRIPIVSSDGPCEFDVRVYGAKF